MRRLPLLAVLALPPGAAALEADADPEAYVQLAPALYRPSLPLSDALAEALAERDHSAAIAGLAALKTSDLSGRAAAELNFLKAWTFIRADRADEAVPLLQTIDKADRVPATYRSLTRAELLLADDRPVDAARALEDMPEDAALWPRAALITAEALADAGRTADARALYERIVQRPDPASGSDLALMALAKLEGPGAPDAYPYVRRIWAWYPTGEVAAEAAALLKGYSAKPTWQEVGARGERLMYAGLYSKTTSLLESRKEEVRPHNAGATPESCRYWYAYGRSQFKRNNVTLAASVLHPWGERCAGVEDSVGPKMLYLAGKGEERKKAWASAMVPYEAIGRLYPESSYADDGMLLAGIAAQEAGNLARARAIWADQVERYPEGDMAGEGYWRLAWGSYLSGDAGEAIRWAEKMTWSLPQSLDPLHYEAGLYWAARWRLYPDVRAPTVMVDDPAALAEALRLWRDMVRDQPLSFYSQLAAARLQELNPGSLDDLPRPSIDRDSPPWEVREAFLDEPAVQAGMALSRLGLLTDAMAEFETLPRAELLPGEVAFIQRIQWDLDWLKAHDFLHRNLMITPDIGPSRDNLLLLAYPEQYWEEVQTASEGYRFDPRIFLSLVREESNFNRKVVSWAGARGLSQLMPSTARGVAGWLGMSVTQSQLNDPATNLKIGARYLESLFKRFRGNPHLSLAGYNAGEGNVDKWLAKRGNVPVDEFVEAIPIRETREYVKRVLGTYQVYRVLYEEGPLYPDWSPYNHQAKPAQAPG